MKKIHLILIFAFVCLYSKSQNVISSSAYLQTCVQKTNCYSESNRALIFFNETKNELVLKIEFDKFKSKSDTLDNWIDDLLGTSLYYVIQLNKQVFEAISNNTQKNVKVLGSVYLNGIWHNNEIELVIFKNNNNGITNTTTNNNHYDEYSVSFGFSFMPKDYKIHKRPHHLKNQITIGVTAGKINELKPEFENFLKEINR